jgi:hypothetical protein
MASTTIRIRAQDKRLLRRLQGEVERAGGPAASQTDLLSRALQFAARNRDRFVLEAAWTPLSEAEIRTLDGLASDLGDWTADDVDTIVYGEP